MPYGLYLSAAGANLQSDRLQVLSNNLANVDTPGFKRDFAMAQARHAEEIERGYLPPGTGGPNDVGGGVSLHETLTDFSRGIFKPTGMATDFALDDDGGGFFAVLKGDEQLLTRAGNFRIDAEGRLLTQDGYSVLNSTLDPVQFDPSGPPPRMEAGGVLNQGGLRIPLAVLRPKSFGDLVKMGETMFRPLAETDPAEAGQRSVREGVLEMSSVRPIEATVQMIEASRAYEANVRLIQHQDSMLGSLVGRLLRQ